MMPFVDALKTHPWRLLILIGRRRGLRLRSNLRKAPLVDHLAQALSQPLSLAQTWQTLPAAEQALIQTLLHNGGQVPLIYLLPQYGPFRPPRQLPDHYHTTDSTRPPDDPPLSPLERLRLLGLVFYDSSSRQIFIPVDLQPILTDRLPPLSPAGPTLIDETGAPPPALLLCHDLACLLGLLRRQTVRPIQHRWLPPTLLATWGDLCAQPPHRPNARGQLQTGRRRFIHYLAESAGFVNGELRMKNKENERYLPFSILSPTPAADLWLNQPHPQQLTQLWQAWHQPDLGRWQRFRLPGMAWLRYPADLLSLLTPLLPQLPAAPAQVLAQQSLRYQPQLIGLAPTGFDRPEALLQETIAHLFSGPYCWLGLLHPTRPAENSADSSLALSQAGAHLIAGSDPPPAPAPLTYTITAQPQPDSNRSCLTVTPQPGLARPADMAALIELADQLPQLDQPAFQLTAASISRAVHRGWSGPALLAALNRLAQPELGQTEQVLLRAWVELANQATLHQPLILETHPEVISRLAATRRGKALIRRTLSPRTVIVDPRDQAKLIRRLTEQEGAPPHLKVGGLPASPDENPNKKATPTAAEALPINAANAYLWLAIQVYQGLGQLIDLPGRIPQSLLDQLSQSASAVDRAAADQAAQQVLAAVQQAVTGQTAFPPWPQHQPDVAAYAAQIEQALAAGQLLKMRYYSAGRDLLTTRRVEPYRLEQHGDTLYVIGFCHRVQAERMFRLDRIEALTSVSPDEHDYAPPTT